jgi:hypothetical protein
MIFEKFIDSDLGHVSYIVGCDLSGEVFIVDPRRDIDQYVRYLEKNSLNLKYVFNTHIDADYISGHFVLVNKYSIGNIFQNSTPIENLDIIKIQENDEFCIGSTLKVKIIDTSGQTPFDISLLLSENEIEKSLFTSDFLFVGDIGRPTFLKKMVGINIVEPRLIENILCDIKRIEFDNIKDKKNIQIINLRESENFHKNHIKNSINICEFSNVSLVGSLTSKFDEIINFLRVGIDNIRGIINSDFNLIDNKYLDISNIISRDDIDDSFINILHDKYSSSPKKLIQSSISEVESLAISSFKLNNNIYTMV